MAGWGRNEQPQRGGPTGPRSTALHPWFATSRYSVVPSGTTLTLNEPSGVNVIVGPGCQSVVPGVRCSSVTGPATPVTRPVSWRAAPGTATPGGRASVSTPTPDHQVERSPSWPRTKLAGSGTCPVAPLTSTALARPVAGCGWSAVTPTIPSCREANAAPIGTGPQLWYGESVSYGSATE